MMAAMDTDGIGGSSGVQRPTGVPRPRPFPPRGTAPGPRCGHTLTTITGADGDPAKAKLVLFGELLMLCVAGHQ